MLRVSYSHVRLKLKVLFSNMLCWLHLLLFEGCFAKNLKVFPIKKIFKLNKNDLQTNPRLPLTLSSNFVIHHQSETTMEVQEKVSERLIHTSRGKLGS